MMTFIFSKLTAIYLAITAIFKRKGVPRDTNARARRVTLLLSDDVKKKVTVSEELGLEIFITNTINWTKGDEKTILRREKIIEHNHTYIYPEDERMQDNGIASKILKKRESI